MTETTDIFRAYKIQHSANEKKVKLIADLLPTWQKALDSIQEIQIEKLRNGKRLGWLNKDFKPNNKLSARQWKSVTNQVNNDLKSWLAKLTIAMRPEIYGLDLNKDEKEELYKINLNHDWWNNNTLKPILEKDIEKNPAPTHDKTRVMLMDVGIAKIVKSKKAKAFDYWAEISLASSPYKPIKFPVETNPYYEEADGEYRNMQVLVTENNEVYLTPVKRSEIEVPTVTSKDVIGLDWGLVNIITTSDGRLLGKQLYKWLLDRDKELLALERALRKNKIRLNNSKRYRRLQARIRDYATNEMGRIVNLLAKDDLRAIVVEDLDFRGGGLSRRLNRIITRAGRKVLRQRLATLAEVSGVEIIEVHAPYSSRECSNCGFVSKRNRKSQSRFVCKFCGYSINADVNAARVV